MLKLFQKLATGCGGEEPPQAKRNAERSTQKGEQTVKANHPGDGLLERLCGPPSGADGHWSVPHREPSLHGNARPYAIFLKIEINIISILFNRRFPMKQDGKTPVFFIFLR